MQGPDYTEQVIDGNYIKYDWYISKDDSRFVIVDPPKPKSRLYITPHFSLDQQCPPPNKFIQLMHKVFFGFKWESLNDS